MNKACHEAMERIYPYLDGELTPYKRARIRWHLRKCEMCPDVYDFESRLKQVVHDQAQEEVPDDVVDRLLHFLRDNDCDC
jgi:mycothiol system anti-sigma-R factor